ncbi:MAG TPA: NCS2 family permease [Streptosporangiaceae bacterium]
MSSTQTRPPQGGFDRFFAITRRGSTVGREIRGGVATFFTMAYIVVLNPLIIGTAPDVHHNILHIGPVAAVTTLVAAVLTLLMGLVGNFPLAIAAGLGLNAFLASTLAPQMSWADAMGLVVIEGLVIMVLVLTGFRTAIFRAVPAPLKSAIAVGIGLFIALVGLVDGGIVHRIPDAAKTTVPVQLGATGNLAGWPTVVFIVGLAIAIVLIVLRVRGAILISIVAATVVALIVQAAFHPTTWSLVTPGVPHTLVSLPDLHLLGHFSLLGSWQHVGAIAAVLFAFTLILADFFDAMGTIVGIGAEAELLDEHGDPPHIGRIFFVDGLAAAAGGAASASSNTGYVESAAGVGEGARTGLASVVTAILFAIAMFFTPLVQIVPFEAATPALVVVGFLMATQIRRIDFTDYSIAIPAFLTIVLMPFTYSITNGIGAGFVSYVLIKVCQRQARLVHPLMWLVALLFLVYFAISPIKELLHLG